MNSANRSKQHSKETLQERWQSLESAKEQLIADLAGYIECEHRDLIDGIAEVLGEEMPALSIARCVDRALFKMDGDAWRMNVRRRIMAAVFGHCA